MTCDCGHDYLTHSMESRDGVLCGGLWCKECTCQQFDNDHVRLLADYKNKQREGQW